MKEDTGMAFDFRRFIRRYGFLLLFSCLLLLGIASVLLFYRARLGQPPRGQTIPVNGSSLTESGGESGMVTGEQRVSVLLSEGQAQPQAVQALPVATGEPLSPGEIEQILARLPQITPESGDQVDFRLAQDPIPPPRPGETIQEDFPPSEGSTPPETVPAGPLEVLRFAPEGEIPIAPFVNITFNQPMVPLTALEDLAAEQVPARMEPALPGTWRWLGTKTLTFQYDSDLIDRLPKATLYRISVPAGTTSAVGGVLAQTVEWSFSTPPPKVVTNYPYDVPQPLEPLFFIAFDQRIDAAAVLDTIQVRAGNQPVSLRMAEQADIQADEQVNRLMKSAQEGRWLAFRAAEPLPADTTISVSVGPGTPSAEGPLVTQAAHTYSFHTYAPLRIDEHGCAWSQAPCQPLTPFYIRFNNPIDAQVYQESWITIQPELPGASVNIYGNTLNIEGATKGQTTYTVVVKGDIQDVFGQKLGNDASLTFKVGPADPVLVGPQQNFVTVDPAAPKPALSVYVINYPRLDVKIYAVQPSDWPAFKLYLREYQRTDKPLQIPGRLVLDKTLPVEAPADTLTEVPIDLSAEMDGKFGQFIV